MLGLFGLPWVAWGTIAVWAQAVTPPAVNAGISEIAVLFTGASLLYLSKQVLSIGKGVEALNETVSGERGLQSAVTRIEEHYARVNDMVTTVAATQQTMEQVISHNTQRLDACPYHGPDRRHPGEDSA